MEIIPSIQHKIYEIRSTRIMLDFYLAALYEVETRVLNQAVKRNIARFPEDFMFQITRDEYVKISQEIYASDDSSSQFVMMNHPPANRTNKYLPYAFTEQGVAMLSGVLKSSKAIQMNIAIMRAFVDLRNALLQQGGMREELDKIMAKIGDHDIQLTQIYDVIESLLDEKASQEKWGNRKRIGYK